jgi:xanthosine utilization system XapX-like protein
MSLIVSITIGIVGLLLIFGDRLLPLIKSLAKPQAATSRKTAFDAAETLIGYFDAQGHQSGSNAARDAAAWLFAESEE